MRKRKTKKSRKTKKKVKFNGDKISEILEKLPDIFEKDKTTIGDLRDAFSGRAYGILMFILALPNLVPIPAPGLSAIVGIPLIFLTTQLVIGIKTPWLPRFIAKRPISIKKLEKMCKYIIPYIKKIEKVITPRFTWLVVYPADRVIALLCLMLSIAVMMPIPFGNAVPALGICLFAIAILQRDGLFALLGLLVAIISDIIIIFFSGAVGAAIDKFLSGNFLP